MILFQAKRSGKYDQGILDVGLTAEDHVEQVRTHAFTRNHATGKAKIEAMVGAGFCPKCMKRHGKSKCRVDKIVCNNCQEVGHLKKCCANPSKEATKFNDKEEKPKKD